ncbi:MAG: class I SAM-dependent methyltransferase [Halobacteriales archaeon]|nr:class I SAM-dependent methyltransferase [Halobacteriales archaeon]
MDDQHERVRRGYDALADAYQTSRADTLPDIEIVDRFVDALPDGATVFDAGCGAGQPVTTALREHGLDPVGLDISFEQVRLARQNVPEGRFVQGDLTALPYHPAQFDAAVAFYSVIHVPRDRHGTVYGELHRVLTGGGLLLVTVGIEAWEGHNPDWLDTGVEMLWSFPSIETSIDLLGDAGFTILDRCTVDDSLGGEYAMLLVRAER